MATGLFGVREETIQRVKIVEFKYAQGAKPGLGGHLLGPKVTEAVARIRETVPGSSLFSPFPFHSVYSVEDHKKHIDWIKAVNTRALVSVKVSTPSDVDMVAVGSYYAGAHIIHLDGSYGGTGAAPDVAKKNIAMPIEYAIPKVHNFLVNEGVRDQITLIASGGIRTAYDIAKAIALGADGVVTGTSELVALECIRCHNCESGRGCARGLATTDLELVGLMDLAWGTQRIINMLHCWRDQLRELLYRLGMTSIRELAGRTDVLAHLDYNSDVPDDDIRQQVEMRWKMKYSRSFAEKILAGRIREFGRADFGRNVKPSDEGGCGVTGFASNMPVAGRHIFEPSVRMHNRGNGKGGGIAAVGLNPEMLGVTREVLDSHYMLNVALLDPACLTTLKENLYRALLSGSQRRDPRPSAGLSRNRRTRSKAPRHLEGFCKGEAPGAERIHRRKRLSGHA